MNNIEIKDKIEMKVNGFFYSSITPPSNPPSQQIEIPIWSKISFNSFFFGEGPSPLMTILTFELQEYIDDDKGQLYYNLDDPNIIMDENGSLQLREKKKITTIIKEFLFGERE